MGSTGVGKHREDQPEYGLRITAQRELRKGTVLNSRNRNQHETDQSRYQSRHLKAHQFTHLNSHSPQKRKNKQKARVFLFICF